MIEDFSGAIDEGVVLVSFLLTLIQQFLVFRVVNRSFDEDSRYLWIYTVGIIWGSFGGTTFRDADLSCAQFNSSVLKNIDLRAESIRNCVWRDVKRLDFSRLGETYLSDRRIQLLVRTGQGNGQSFDRLDLRGIDLSHADLRKCSFRSTDLSGANLQGADLTDAMLVQTQLDDANLGGTILTGATIEDWGLTVNTSLNGVCCRYVFMKEVSPGSSENRRRKPDDWNQEFENNDFADFIKPLTDTLDLYHNRNVDPRAIAIAFKHISDDNPDANLKIVAMESRGEDKFMLRVQTEQQADKSALNAQYTNTYNQVRSLPADQQMQLLLAEKDNRIQSLERFLKQAIDCPNFQVQGDNYNMSGHGDLNISRDDHSTNVSGSGIVVGDHNTTDIKIQQIDLPEPQTINIQQELLELKQLLTRLQSADQRKISNALSDAEDELKKPQPDKDEVGQALGRALDYAKKAEGFATSIDKLRPHVQNAAAWLGKNWYKLLVGLAA